MLARTKLQIAPKFFLSILPLICLASIGLGFGVGIVQNQLQVNEHRTLPRDL